MPERSANVADDRELLQRIVAGDKRALLALHDRHGDMVIRCTWSVMRSEQDAKDVAQDVWSRVARRAETFSGDGTVRSWVWSIAINTSRSAYRKRLLLQKRIDADASCEDLAGQVAPPLSTDIPLPAWIAACFSLPPRVVFVAGAHSVGFQHAEIGGALGASTVMSRKVLSRDWAPWPSVLQRLASALDESGHAWRAGCLATLEEPRRISPRAFLALELAHLVEHRRWTAPSEAPAILFAGVYTIMRRVACVAIVRELRTATPPDLGQEVEPAAKAILTELVGQAECDRLAFDWFCRDVEGFRANYGVLIGLGGKS